MQSKRTMATVVALASLFAAMLFNPGGASAHCDTMDGPVVQTAKEALQTGNLNPVLAWIEERDEGEVRSAFSKAMAARNSGAEAQEAADMEFFETVVRLHRASEGEPFTGLKPAGTDLGPVVPVADQALRDGSADALVTQVTSSVEEGIVERFNNVMSKKDYNKNDVQAGREYVEAYVGYVHFAEEIYGASKHTAEEGHAQEGAHSQQAGPVEAAHMEDEHATAAQQRVVSAPDAALPATGAAPGNEQDVNYLAVILAGLALMGFGALVLGAATRKWR